MENTMVIEKYIADLVAKAKVAQAQAENYTQEDVDKITEALAYAFTRPEVTEMYGKMLVEESNFGDPAHKKIKMMNKLKGAYAQMKGQKSVGLVEVIEERGLEKYAKPMGVIAAIIPVTNGEATPVLKSMMALKGRNAIILSPHPNAKVTNLHITNKIREVIASLGYPADLVQTIEPDMVSMDASRELMAQTDFILATGGTPLVIAAQSSGTPAIGVGQGNDVSIIDETADLAAAAEKIMISKAWDNATSCSTENNVVCVEAVYDEFVAELAKRGGYTIKEGTEDKQKMTVALWPEYPEKNKLNNQIIMRDAQFIANAAGVEVPEGTKVIFVEENDGFGVAHPFSGEKLSPVSGLFKAKDFDDAINILLNIQEYQGKGHGAGIHTALDERVTEMALRVPVCRMIVNMPQCLSNSGSYTCGLAQTMTIGCGTWGKNGVSHNVTFRDLLNYTYVAREIPSTEKTEEELFTLDLTERKSLLEIFK